MYKDDVPDTQAVDTHAIKIADAIDLGSLELIFDSSTEPLRRVAGDTGRLALIQVGAPSSDAIVNQVNDQAVNYAKERAAELVGKKIVEGELVDNPAAEWSITEATRNEIRSIIEQAVAGNIELADLEGAIRDAGAFSETRAALIARTEISRAHNYGALNGYLTARANGVDVKKAWLPDDIACDLCLDNEADGAIELDEQFATGDLAPPAHPNCECAIIPVVASENDA